MPIVLNVPRAAVLKAVTGRNAGSVPTGKRVQRGAQRQIVLSVLKEQAAWNARSAPTVESVPNLARVLNVWSVQTLRSVSNVPRERSMWNGVRGLSVRSAPKVQNVLGPPNVGNVPSAGRT